VAQGSLSKKEINGGNAAVPGNDEVSPGVSWPPAIAQFFGPGSWLTSKVRTSSRQVSWKTIRAGRIVTG
jgi:hypothetical protein